MFWVEPEKKQSGDSLSIENSMSENGIMNISHCLNLEMNAEIGFVSNNQQFLLDSYLILSGECTTDSKPALPANLAIG